VPSSSKYVVSIPLIRWIVIDYNLGDLGDELLKIRFLEFGTGCVQHHTILEILKKSGTCGRGPSTLSGNETRDERHRLRVYY
jgi:hypothetical protein